MLDLLQMQKDFINNHLKSGDVAVDFTMGNGHDTLFLSKTVGENGHVYAFDIQEAALVSTAKNLKENSPYNNYTLIHDSHHNLTKYLPQGVKFKAGMFNLGFLPGNNKEITTKRETTLLALECAIENMDKDSVILVAVYPGHLEGEIEGKLVIERLSKLDRKQYCVCLIQLQNSPTSPYFIAIESK